MKLKLFFIIGLLLSFLTYSVYGTASLNVISTPEGADIYINGTTTGETTPHIFLNLSSYDFMGGGFAWYLVTLRKDGYPKPGYAMGMGVEGTTSTVTIDFNALYSGSLTITSDPNGAEIYLDGAPAGELVKTLKEPEGKETIEWDGKNESGDEVISGIYLYTTESDKERNACSFTIIKK